jgi:hypothetical protein
MYSRSLEKVFFRSAILILLLLPFFSGSPVFGESEGGSSGWQKISDLDDIQVYKKEITDRPLIALKGETVLNFPIEKVATVMDQIEKQPQWVPYLLEARQLRQISFYERLIYTCSRSPWPVKDRDFLAHSSVEVDQKREKITVRMRSVEGHEVAVRTDRVRGDLSSCIIVVQSLEGGQKTYFSIEILVDPKGWIPKWVVNLVQRKLTRKYIEGLRVQVARPEIKDHPLILELFHRR